MKTAAVCGSPRKGGNTEQALSIILDNLSKKGIETELITTYDKDIRGCTACMKCRDKKDGKCYGRKDDVNAILDILYKADAILLGSPVYFGSATTELKAIIDRAGYVARASGNVLKHKIGGAVVVARRAGHNFTFAQINYFFTIMEMIQIGSSYWNIIFGGGIGEIEKDVEGIATLKQYAENVAWLLHKTIS
jgi:multimeric flavodoxin WrbA